MPDRILIRFNTKHSEDPEGRRWRVLVNCEERLAHTVRILAPVETITEAISTGEVKDHFLAEGRVAWDEGHRATVTTDAAALA